MAGLPEGFFAGENNRRTNRAVNDLAASQRAAESRLRSAIDKHARETKALAVRIERLEKSLRAIVDMEETREELKHFTGADATRRYARSLLPTSTTEPGSDRPLALSSVPEDVAGYWLAPAAHVVAAWRAPGATDASEHLAEARRRDRPRTDLFLACAAALCDEPERANPFLDAVLPRQQAVTVSQRAVWSAAAAGQFGRAGQDALIAALRRLVGSSEGTADPQRVSEVAAQLRTLVGAKAAAMTPVEAGRHLESLRAWLEPAAIESGNEPDRAEGLAETIDMLLDEGAPGEGDLLDRMAEVRQELAPIGVDAAPRMQPADVEAGSVWALLLDDLATGTAGRRRVARDVLAPWIDMVVAGLAEQAQTPPATEVRVSAFGTVIRVNPDGPTLAELRKAQTAHAIVHRQAWMRPAAITAAIAGALAAVLAIAVAPGLLVLAVIAVVAAGLLWFRFVTSAQRAAADHEQFVASQRARLDEATAKLNADIAEAERTAAAADGHVAAIRAALSGSAIARLGDRNGPDATVPVT